MGYSYTYYCRCAFCLNKRFSQGYQEHVHPQAENRNIYTSGKRCCYEFHCICLHNIHNSVHAYSQHVQPFDRKNSRYREVEYRVKFDEAPLVLKKVSWLNCEGASRDEQHKLSQKEVWTQQGSKIDEDSYETISLLPFILKSKLNCNEEEERIQTRSVGC